MPSRKKPGQSRSPISRRRFIQGVGAGAAAAVTVTKLGHAQLQIDEETRGQPRVPIRLRINGRTFRLNVEARWTLLEVLRNQLDLTGTKLVCDRGECGACTVLRDGQPVYSCLTLAVEAQDHEIETIESLSPDGRSLHPLQEAFVKNDALQCGFCTPGMVMSLKALLDRNQKPSHDDVVQAISGNLCKCGTYTKIFRAAQDAARTMRERG